ncbi:MAG TPA: hypothetical protein VM532_00735, partial [Burkholderiales bacterium]|nr:hypothetical protein [Burkholderiales bacterium]
MDPTENNNELTLDDLQKQFLSWENIDKDRLNLWVGEATSYFNNRLHSFSEAWAAAQGLKSLLTELKAIQSSVASHGSPAPTPDEGVEAFMRVAGLIGSQEELLKIAIGVLSEELLKCKPEDAFLEQLARMTNTVRTKPGMAREWLTIGKLEKEILNNYFSKSSSRPLPERLKAWAYVGRLREIYLSPHRQTCTNISEKLKTVDPNEFRGSDLRHLAVLINECRSAGLERHAKSLIEKMGEIITARGVQELEPMFAQGDGDKKNLAETAALIVDTLAESTSLKNWEGLAWLGKNLSPFGNSPACRRVLETTIAGKFKLTQLGQLTTNNFSLEGSDSDLRHLVVLIDSYRSAGLKNYEKFLARKVGEIIAASDDKGLKPLFSPGDGDNKRFAETAALIAGGLVNSPLSDNWGTLDFLAKSLRPFPYSQACCSVLSIIAGKLNSAQLTPLTADDIPHAFSLIDSFATLPEEASFPSSGQRVMAAVMRERVLTYIFEKIASDPELLIEADKYCRMPEGEPQNQLTGHAIPHAFPLANSFAPQSEDLLLPDSVARVVANVIGEDLYGDHIPGDPAMLIAADKYGRLAEEGRRLWLPRIAGEVHRRVENFKAKTFSNEQEEREEFNRLGDLLIRLPADGYGAAKHAIAEWGRERASRWESEGPAVSYGAVGSEVQAGKRVAEEAARLEAEKALRAQEQVRREREEAAKEALEAAEKEKRLQERAAQQKLEAIERAQEQKAEQALKEGAKEATEVEAGPAAGKTGRTEDEAVEQEQRQTTKSAEDARKQPPAAEQTEETQARQGPGNSKAAGQPQRDVNKKTEEKRRRDERAKRTADEVQRAKEDEARLKQEKANKEAAEKRVAEDAKRVQAEAVRLRRENVAREAKEAEEQSKRAVRAAAAAVKSDGNSLFVERGNLLSQCLNADPAHLDNDEAALRLDVLRYASPQLERIEGIKKDTRRRFRERTAKALVIATDHVLAPGFDAAARVNSFAQIVEALGCLGKEKDIGKPAIRKIANAMSGSDLGGLLAVNSLGLVKLADQLKQFPQLAQANDTARRIWEHFSSDELSSDVIRTEDLPEWGELLWKEQPNRKEQDQSLRREMEMVTDAESPSDEQWVKIRQMIMNRTQSVAMGGNVNEAWRKLWQAQPEDMQDACVRRPWLMMYISEEAPKEVPERYDDAREKITNAQIERRKDLVVDSIQEVAAARLGKESPKETASQVSDSDALAAEKSRKASELIHVIMDALNAPPEQAVERTRKVHKLLEHWSSADLGALVQNQDWLTAIDKFVKERANSFIDLLHMPIGDARSTRFIKVIRKWLGDNDIKDLQRSLEGELPQHIELVDLVRKFYVPHGSSLPNSMKSAQTFMLEHKENLGTYAQYSFTADVFVALKAPNKTLSSFVAEQDIVHRRQGDPKGVDELLRRTLACIRKFRDDESDFVDAMRSIEAQQRALGTGREGAIALLLGHPAATQQYVGGIPWRSEIGLRTWFKNLDNSLEQCERAQPIVEAVRDALQPTDDEALALARTEAVHSRINEWMDDESNAGFNLNDVLKEHPEWPEAIGLDKWMRMRKILLHVPV